MELEDMTFENLIDYLSGYLVELGDAATRLAYEPNILGNVNYPVVAVQYNADDTEFTGGSDELSLPPVVSMVIHFYYPVRTVGRDDEDGLVVAQKETLAANSSFRESLWEDPSLGGLMMRTEIAAGRAYQVEDEDQGDLYTHELTLNIYVH